MSELLSVETASLARTPVLVAEIVKGRPAVWLDAHHVADALSPRETLGHFIMGEREDWIPRIRIILEYGESQPFEPFDVHGGNASSQEREVDDLLTEFATLRRESLVHLAAFNLTEEDLAKAGTHPKFGSVTLDQLISTWVAHDLYHMGQIFKAFSVAYRDRVGPWQEFLNLPQFS